MGSFSVINNLPAINGQNQLNINNLGLSRTLNRLASGKRLNTGADDAAGLQIADKLRGNIMALNQSVRNANDGISVLQIADGALGQVTDMLHRMVTLATNAANVDIITTSGSKALQQEYNQLASEIARLAGSTMFNGQKIFGKTEGMNIFVGDLDNSTAFINVKAGDLAKVGESLVGAGPNMEQSAASVESVLRDMLQQVSEMRGSIGATMNRLQATINVLTTQSQNTLSAESTIRDANIAEEISNLTKHQILAQTGIAALAQANANSQNVLGLLR